MKKWKILLAMTILTVITASAFAGCGNQAEPAKTQESQNTSSVVSKTEQSSETSQESTESSAESSIEDSKDEISEASAESSIQESTDNSEETSEESSSEESTEESSEQSESEIHQKLAQIISESDAVSYTVAKIEGSDSYFLILSFGEVEAARYYDIYEIGNKDITLVGEKIVGSHTVLYISNETGTAGIYQGHMGNYAYGPLVYKDGTVSLDWTQNNGTVEPDESYPELPGEQIDMTSPDNLDMIANF